MVNPNRIDMPILNFIFLIVFNIGMGAVITEVLEYSNLVFNFLWFIAAFFGNTIIVKLRLENE